MINMLLDWCCATQIDLAAHIRSGVVLRRFLKGLSMATVTTQAVELVAKVAMDEMIETKSS